MPSFLSSCTDPFDIEWSILLHFALKYIQYVFHKTKGIILPYHNIIIIPFNMFLFFNFSHYYDRYLLFTLKVCHFLHLAIYLSTFLLQKLTLANALGNCRWHIPTGSYCQPAEVLKQWVNILAPCLSLVFLECMLHSTSENA